MMRNALYLSLAVLCLFAAGTYADVPSDCRFKDALGEWVFELSAPVLDGETAKSKCMGLVNPMVGVTITTKKTITLSSPNVAEDDAKNKGNWTLIYNQGFEVTIAGQKYFAWFKWTTDAAKKTTSYCGETTVGWFHEATTVPGKLPLEWGCYTAKKTVPVPPRDNTVLEAVHPNFKANPEQVWQEDSDLATRINAQQSSWVADPSGRGQYHGLKVRDVIKQGTTRSVSSRQLVEEIKEVVGSDSSLKTQASNANTNDVTPPTFDYRNISGVDYTFMRDQLNCGSCYAFGATEMLSQRLRIRSNNKDKAVYSVQEILSCSNYSQGCDGGFPYLVGKYGEDYGIPTEQCFGYYSGFMGFSDMPSCSWRCSDPKLIRGVSNYHYVGGYFGGCNEADMEKELLAEGPLAVAFEVYPDFELYTKGIYHHTGLTSTVNPFVETNHAVLVVGFGTDVATGEKYWVVQNSWGRHFGMAGFFYIRRGSNECGIESEAVGATPVDAVVGPPVQPGPDQWGPVVALSMGVALIASWVFFGIKAWNREKVSLKAAKPLMEGTSYGTV